MGVKERAEACGRCAMSTASDIAGGDYDPFDGDRIEVDEDEMRTVSKHVVALGTVKDRLNEWATRVTYSQR